MGLFVMVFTDVFTDVTSHGRKIPKSDYQTEGAYPIIDQGQEKIAGYSDCQEVFSDVPVIVFGDHTRKIKYIDEPFLLGADGVKVLKPKLSNVNVKYLYYCLCNVKIPNTGYNRHFKFLKQAAIAIPERKKQDNIVEILDELVKIQELRNREVLFLDELVKARFVEIFGNIGQDNKGWGLTTLGKACIINPHRPKNINTNLDYSFVPMPSVSEHGSIDTSVCKPYKKVKNGYTYFQENDVLFAKITPCMENGKGAVAQGLKNGIGFGSTEFHVLRPMDGISNPYWLYEITMQPQFRIVAERHMTGSGGQRRVPASFFYNFPISIPPLDFQNHYADFVQKVDKSKAAIQKSIDETQLLYDSLMQKYFG